MVKLLLGRQVDGILLVPQSPKTYENIRTYTDQVPTVFLSENLRDQPQSYVAVDNSHGTYLGVEYLYNLGHRKILYLGRRQSTTHQLRAEGYMRACQHFGLQERFFNSEYNRSSIENGYEMARELFAKPIDYTAIFASTDSNALGILKAADELGIEIPGQVSLIGFDNIRSTSLPRIELTTIEQPKREMAVQAVDMRIGIAVLAYQLFNGVRYAGPHNQNGKWGEHLHRRGPWRRRQGLHFHSADFRLPSCPGRRGSARKHRSAHHCRSVLPLWKGCCRQADRRRFPREGKRRLL